MWFTEVMFTYVNAFWALFGLFLKLLELPGAATGAGGTGEFNKWREKKNATRFFAEGDIKRLNTL